MNYASRLASVTCVLAALAVTAVVLSSACSATGSARFTSGVGGGGGAASTSGSSNGGSGGSVIAFDAGTGAGTGTDPTTCAEAATSRTNIGCDFWPTVVANQVWSIFDYAVVVANAGTQTANVTVSRGGATLQTGQVAPNALTTFYLPWVSQLKGADGNKCGSGTAPTASVRQNAGAYHLVTSVPVTVYQFNALEYRGQGGAPGKNWASCPGSQLCDDPTSLEFGFSLGCFSFTNDASLLLPTTALTGNYRLTSQSGWSDPVNQIDVGAYFAITGTQDNTNVTVYLPAKGQITGDGAGIPPTGPNGTLALTLNAGDVVELLGTGPADNAGALVQASHPVQVISGMPCTFQPFDITALACDHIEQSVFPAETLGKHYFVTVPTAPNGDVVGHIVRIVGNVDGTKLTYPSGNAPLGAPAMLNAGQVADLGLVGNDFEIEGDHEIAVVNFMLGGSLLDPTGGLGDPSQSNATAVEQYRAKYVFLAPVDYTTSYVDVVAPVGATVRIDGKPLTATPKTIGSGFTIARQRLGAGNNGAHVLTASQPVGIQVIGYGEFTSYMYPGGLNLSAIAPPPPPPT